MTAISIRLLRAEETDQAAVISRRAMMTVPGYDETLHTPEEDRAFWREHVFPTCEIWGVFAGTEKLVGQAAVSEGWVHQFHIHPDSQGCGIGSALLGALKVGMADIQLWTFQANLGAQRFYERHGFIPVEYTDGARNEERKPDVRYRWLR